MSLRRALAVSSVVLVTVAGCGSGMAPQSGSTQTHAPSAAGQSGMTPLPSASRDTITGVVIRPSTADPSSSSPAPITVVAPPTHTADQTTTTETSTDRSTTGSTTTPATSTESTGSTVDSSAPASSTVDSSTPTNTAQVTPSIGGGIDLSGVTIPAGSLIVIDPGHNGQNASHPEIIHQQVPSGFGQHKNCNTTGTATVDGYPEHKFNWKVANDLKTILADNGVTVVMTRDSDDGVGPCVNKRAAIGNKKYDGQYADAVVSIHGDGEKSSIHGFFAMTASRPPAGEQIAAQTNQLARDIVDGLSSAGFPISSIGTNGLWPRDDLGGLNLSKRPTVMLELGNMKNGPEAAMMTSADGQLHYAQGIAAGVFAFLNR